MKSYKIKLQSSILKMNGVQKLSMCRICLVENVRMFVVSNKNLQEIYEKLTDIPLLTEDRRPMLACFLCYNRLKQCYQLQRKCLQAENLFTRMLNEDYEAKPLLDQGHLEFSGYIISPTVHISISDKCLAETGNVIIENMPADHEGQNDFVELKEEHQSETEQEFQVIEYLDRLSDQEDLLPQLESEDILPHHSESVSEDEKPLMEFKTEEEEEQELSIKKRQAKMMTRAHGVKKLKIDSRRANLEETVTAQPKKIKQRDSKIIRKTQSRTSKPVSKIKKPASNYNDIKKHIRVYTSENPLRCDVCQRSFSKTSTLKRHMRLHTGEKPFKCEICQRSFSDRNIITNHMRVHTGEKPFRCDICQRTFSEKRRLICHMRVHTGEKPFRCEICQRSFSEKSSLRNHMRVHTGEKPFRCDACQRSFSEKRSLISHMRLHTGEKPFRCDVCQRSYRDKSSLRKHNMRLHTGENPFKCDVCQRSFSDNTSLRNHMRVHTGEKPFTCDICQHNFGRKSSLTSHMRLHTGEKPFKCDVCLHSFRYSRYLKIHKLQIHMIAVTS